MAMKGIYVADGTTKYTSADVKLVNGKIVGGKIIYGDTDLKVEAQSSPNMSVKVSAGLCSINGAFLQNDSSYTVTITSNSSSYSRKDAIVAYISGTTFQIKAVQGTPSASPVAPTVNSSSYIKLAEVYVGVGVSSIQNSNITDCRNTVGQNITDSLMDEIVTIKTRINNVSDTIFYTKPTDTWTIEITPIKGENFSKVRMCGATIVKSNSTTLDRRENLPFKITFADRISFTCMMKPPEGNYWQGVASGYGCCMYIVNSNSLRIVTHGLTAGVNYVQHWSFDSYTLNSELPSDVQAKIKAMTI